MKKSLLIGQVASLSRDIEDTAINLVDFGFNLDTAYKRYDEESTTEGSAHDELADETVAKAGILDGVNLSSRRVQINQLLGEWEGAVNFHPFFKVSFPTFNSCRISFHSLTQSQRISRKL